ncbi:uncharacterized protein N7529_005451 [Penicillium soppii]|uniref:uncharacterized protein n=1 Tax=Penicillium soppii TaxID=69789 RepID=UPI0025480305|nr:uncharacterized protein N7529_005451 [Penicillium soppii]KAJ5863535.1 hypothetical protein N7529_005451 [Penicillium soppii]
MEQFHVTNSVALLPMTVYNVGLALGPIFGALSESYGRQIMYIASITGALVFTVVGAWTTTFYVIVLTRFLTSLCGAPMITVAMGTLNDVWDAKVSRVGAILNFLLTSIAIWGTEIGSPIGPRLEVDIPKHCNLVFNLRFGLAVSRDARNRDHPP